MRRSVELLLALLSGANPAHVVQEDFDGPCGPLLRRWQDAGFVGVAPGVHPVPGCPHCCEGEPYRIDDRLLCDACQNEIDSRELLAWPVRREAFLADLAGRLGLCGGVRMVDDRLWQLGTGSVNGESVECFYHPAASLSEMAVRRIASYRRVFVFHGPTASPPASTEGQCVPLVELFNQFGDFAAPNLADLVRGRGTVRFDRETGALAVGAVRAGEVPLWSREYFFLARLAEHIDQYVPYGDLKRDVLRQTGGKAGIDEATFCQKLKSRIKAQYIAGIDRLIVTTNKGDGYRLKAEG